MQDDSDSFKTPPNFISAIAAIKSALANPEAHEITRLDPLTEAKVDDQKTDTRLKELYAKRFIWILAAQLVVMNSVFILVGLDILSFKEPSYLNLFMGGTLAEVFGVVLVITRYLFSKKF